MIPSTITTRARCRRLAAAAAVVVLFLVSGCAMGRASATASGQLGDNETRREDNKQTAEENAEVTGNRSASGASTNVGEHFGDTKSNRLLIWIACGALAIVAVVSALTSAFGGAWISNRDRRRFHKNGGGGGCLGIDLKLPTDAIGSFLERLAFGHVQPKETKHSEPDSQ